jgi:hypothetical protein
MALSLRLWARRLSVPSPEINALLAKVPGA